MSKTRGEETLRFTRLWENANQKAHGAHCTAPRPRLNEPPHAPQLPSGGQRHGDPPTLLLAGEQLDLLRKAQS